MSADQEPLQETPKGHAIPVPTRKAVLGDLGRVAHAQREDRAPDWLSGYQGLSAEDTQHRARADGRPCRVIRHGEWITADSYRDRVNVWLDRAGNVDRIDAG